MNCFMQEAIKEAYAGISNGEGGPFGAVVVKDNEIIGKGHNSVVKNNDPTCHGEIMAIRNACERLGSFSLKGCEIYTTAEPCPMCLGAILWAGIDKVFYGCNVLDTEDIGFKDSDFYKIVSGEMKSLEMTEVDREGCLELFMDYKKKSDKAVY